MKTYTNGEVTVTWEADKCVHSGHCVKGLPSVFQPKSRPWVRVDEASTDDIIQQVKACPSGALGYYMNEAEQKQSSHSTPIQITVAKNGPLLITTDCEIVNSDGLREMKKGKVALCRCGDSSRKPYCDGSHKALGDWA